MKSEGLAQRRLFAGAMILVAAIFFSTPVA